MKYRVKVGCYFEHKGISHPENSVIEIEGNADMTRLYPLDEPQKETKKATKAAQEEKQ